MRCPTTPNLRQVEWITAIRPRLALHQSRLITFLCAGVHRTSSEWSWYLISRGTMHRERPEGGRKADEVRRVGATPEVDADSGQQREDESNHGSTVVTRRNTSVSGDRAAKYNLLNSRQVRFWLHTRVTRNWLHTHPS